MTVVDYRTGEVVEFDKAAAERRAERISLRLDAVADNYEAAVRLIRDAIEKRDDIALGYRSVGDYLSDRFAGALTRLGLDARRAVVGELTQAGMSTRAIAPVVGVSDWTVRDDQTRARDLAPQTPEPSPAQETDPEGGSGYPVDMGVGGDPHVSRPPVTGIDGKVYSRPAPRLVPTPEPDAWDELDRAEELASNLARNLSLLFAITNPERRAEYIANWRRGTSSRPVLGHDFVTPKHMRDLSAALITFANEWENADV